MATIAGCEDCVASACRRFVRLRSGFVRPLFVVSPCGRRRVCGGARGAGAIIANQSLVGAAGAASGCSLVQPHPLGSSALAFARASARAFAAQVASMVKTIQGYLQPAPPASSPTAVLAPPLFLLITPTQQPRRHQRRLKAQINLDSQKTRSRPCGFEGEPKQFTSQTKRARSSKTGV